jgi:uncharacterized oligopeptide transporter (OPT) family protein
MELVKEH